MKTIFRFSAALIFIFHFSQGLSAQTDGKFKNLRLKIYLNGQMEHNPILLFDKNQKFEKDVFATDKLFSFGDLSVALEWNSSGKFQHEIELLPFKINTMQKGDLAVFDNSGLQISDWGKTTSSFVATKYQLSYQFTEGKKYSPYLGLAGQVSYERENLQPATSTTYPTKTTEIDLYLSLVPGLKYTISKHFFADLTYSFGILNHEMIHKRLENPSIPTNDRSSNNSRTTFLPKKDQFRIGIGYNF